MTRGLGIALLSIVGGYCAIGRVTAPKVESTLELLKAVEFSSEVVAVCPDGERLLLLDGSGTRVIALDSNFAVRETIPLEIRLMPPRGLASDRYYIYLSDDKCLYRLAKDKLTMSAWLNNVRVAGLGGFAPGEVLVSDQERQVVWLKTLFGESRSFLDQSEVRQPKAIVAFPGGVFGVLDGSNRLLKVNRAGIIIGILPLPQGVDLIGVDKEGQVLAGRRGEGAIWVLKDKNIIGYELKGAVNINGIAVWGDKIVVVDGSSRILVYFTPGQ